MTFCNPFLNFSFFSGFAFGNYLGNRITSAIWGNPSRGYVSNPFNCVSGGFQVMSAFPMPSLYMNNVSYVQQSSMFNFNANSFGGFDTFSYSSANTNYNNFGGWSGYNTWSYTQQYGWGTSSLGTVSKNDKKKIEPCGNITFRYANLTQEEALKEAKKDPKLVELKGGKGWTISSFENDIPYARTGTPELLDYICKKYNLTITVTSALGTLNSPHGRGSNSKSHYNELNPKLDFGGGLTHDQASDLKKKLEETGLFEGDIGIEDHGSTSHLDVQFSDAAYEMILKQLPA